MASADPPQRFVEELEKIFPDIERGILLDVLRAHKNDVSAAANYIFSMNEASAPPQSSSDQPTLGSKIAAWWRGKKTDPTKAPGTSATPPTTITPTPSATVVPAATASAPPTQAPAYNAPNFFAAEPSYGTSNTTSSSQHRESSSSSARRSQPAPAPSLYPSDFDDADNHSAHVVTRHASPPRRRANFSNQSDSNSSSRRESSQSSYSPQPTVAPVVAAAPPPAAAPPAKAAEPSGPPLALTKDQKLQLFQNGYCFVPGIVSPELVETALYHINAAIGEGWSPGQSEKSRIGSDLPADADHAACLDLFYKSNIRAIVESVVGAGRLHSVQRAHISVKFPYPPKEFAPHPPARVRTYMARPDAPWKRAWYIDGLPTEAADGANRSNEIHDYTTLVGVLLCDTPVEFAGNFSIFPGTHQMLEDYVRHRGVDQLISEGLPDASNFPLWPPTPVQVTGKAGDIFIMHYMTAHTIAPNFHPMPQYTAMFHVHHSARKLDSKATQEAGLLVPAARPETLGEIWLEWEGMYDILREMQPQQPEYQMTNQMGMMMMGHPGEYGMAPPGFMPAQPMHPMYAAGPPMGMYGPPGMMPFNPAAAPGPMQYRADQMQPGPGGAYFSAPPQQQQPPQGRPYGGPQQQPQPQMMMMGGPQYGGPPQAQHPQHPSVQPGQYRY